MIHGDPIVVGDVAFAAEEALVEARDVRRLQGGVDRLSRDNGALQRPKGGGAQGRLGRCIPHHTEFGVELVLVQGIEAFVKEIATSSHRQLEGVTQIKISVSVDIGEFGVRVFHGWKTPERHGCLAVFDPAPRADRQCVPAEIEELSHLADIAGDVAVKAEEPGNDVGTEVPVPVKVRRQQSISRRE